MSINSPSSIKSSERTIWRYPIARKRILDDFYDLTLLCNKCLYCRFVFTPEARDYRFVEQCPRGETFRFASYYAEGTVEIARGLIEGRLRWSKTIEHILYTCTDCGHCEFWCENAMRVYPLTIMEIMKEHYVREIGLPESWKPIIDNLEKTRNPFGEPQEERFKWLPRELSIPRYADTILFVGDIYAYKVPSIAYSALKILHKLGVEIGLLYEEEWHSGYLFFRVGLYDKGLEFLGHNIKALEKAGAKRVVFLDPHDYRTFIKEVRDANITLPFEVIHFTDFVLPLIGRERHRLKRLDMRVAYHDPCNLTRHIMPFPVWDAPRELLRLMGVDVVELYRTRLNTYCCGGGGGMIFTNQKLTEVVARRRLEEVSAKDVSVLVTACPTCILAFRSIAKNLNIQVYDIIEIIDRSFE